MMAARKEPVTRASAFNFFFGGSIVYGAGFGTLYGAGMGLVFYFYGTLYGAPIGLVLGLALGILDGLILGNHASRLAGQGIPAANIGKAILLLTPLATAASGTVIIAALSIWDSSTVDAFSLLIGIVWLIAIFASWHAAVIVTRKFAREYE
jgi:hypothetical protein